MKSAKGSFQTTVRSVGSTRQRRYDIVVRLPTTRFPTRRHPVSWGNTPGLSERSTRPDALEQLRQLRRIELGAPRDREVMVEVLHADPPVERLVQVLGALRLRQHVADHGGPAPRRPGHEHDVDRPPPQGPHRRTSASKSSKAGFAESSNRRSPKFTCGFGEPISGSRHANQNSGPDVVERPPEREPVGHHLLLPDERGRVARRRGRAELGQPESSCRRRGRARPPASTAAGR